MANPSLTSMISVALSWQCLDSSSRSRSMKQDMGGKGPTVDGI